MPCQAGHHAPTLCATFCSPEHLGPMQPQSLPAGEAWEIECCQRNAAGPVALAPELHECCLDPAEFEAAWLLTLGTTVEF